MKTTRFNSRDLQSGRCPKSWAKKKKEKRKEKKIPQPFGD